MSAHFELESERARLSRSALKAFFRLASCWSLRDGETILLLGADTADVCNMTTHSNRRVLPPDALLRISYLLGIYAALNVLHSRSLADQWLTLPNSNPIFAGGTPLNFMIRGGLPAMRTVRRLLDARAAQ